MQVVRISLEFQIIAKDLLRLQVWCIVGMYVVNYKTEELRRMIGLWGELQYLYGYIGWRFRLEKSTAFLIRYFYRQMSCFWIIFIVVSSSICL